MIKVRPVKKTEAEFISSLAIRSKAFWGYDDDFLELCTKELSYSQGDVLSENFEFYLAEIENKIVGFYKLEDLSKDKIYLDALFIEPDYIGKGVGQSLFSHAKSIAKSYGGKTLQVVSDPNAEPFYIKMGAVTIDSVISESTGRPLPLMELKLC